MSITQRMINPAAQQAALWQRNQNPCTLHPSSGKGLRALRESQPVGRGGRGDVLRTIPEARSRGTTQPGGGLAVIRCHAGTGQRKEMGELIYGREGE